MKRILRVLTLLCLIAIPSLVRAAVSVNFSASGSTVACGPNLFASFTASASGCTGSATYTWYIIRNGSTDTFFRTTSVAPNLNYNFSGNGLYDVAVKVTCGTETAWMTRVGYINVTPQPTIDFTSSSPVIDPAVGCPGTYTFNNASSGDTVCSTHSWRWNVNGPVTFPEQTGTNATYNFTVPGDYTVTLVFIAGGCGCSGFVTKTIHISSLPTACMHRTDANSLCNAPVTVTYSADCSSGATLYTWTFTGASTSTLITSSSPTASATYNSPGNYPIGLTVRNAAGCTAVASPQTIHVGNLVASMAATPATICDGTSISLHDNTTVDAVAPTTNNFVIKNSLGEILFTAPGPDATILMNYGPGTYTIVDNVTNGAGCTAAVSRNITVLPKPRTNIVPSATIYCKTPFTVNFQASPNVPGNTYTWTFNNVSTNTFSGASPVYTYTASGTFAPTLHVVDANGCVFDTVYLNPGNPALGGIFVGLPAMRILATPDSGCTPLHVDFSFTSSPPFDYTVNFVSWGDTVSPPALAGNYTDTGHTFSNTGVDTVKLRVTISIAQGGCTDSASTPIKVGRASVDHTITISDVPGLRDGSKDTVICPATTLFMHDSCIGCTVRWMRVRTGLVSVISNADTNALSAVYNSPSQPVVGSAEPQWLIDVRSCMGGCCARDSFVVRVLPPLMPRLGLTILTDSTSRHCDSPTKIYFKMLGSRGARIYKWDFGDSRSDSVRIDTLASVSTPTTSIIASHVYTVPAPGTVDQYTVSLTGMYDSSFITTSDTSILHHTSSAPPPNIGKVIGLCDSTVYLVITVGRKEQNWSVSDTVICLGASILDTAPIYYDSLTMTNNYYTNYRWGGGGTTISSAVTYNTAVTTYTTTGTFSLYPKWFDRRGCPDSGLAKTIKVFGPKGWFKASPIYVCPGSPITFLDSATFPAGSAIQRRVVSWDYNPMTASGTFTPLPASPTPYTFTHTFATDGTYVVALSDTDNTVKHCASFDTVTVVSKGPHASFTISDTSGICAGLDLTFRDPNKNVRYSWNFGDGVITGSTASDSVIHHTYTANGTYSITVTETSDGTGGYASGCTSTYTRVITLSSSSGIGIANFGDSVAGCPPLQLAVGPTTTPNSYLYTYRWNVTVNDIGSYNSTYLFTTFLHSGLHRVTMYATSPKGCVDSVY